MSGIISSTSSPVSISTLSFRVSSLPLSTNSCGWVRSSSSIRVIVPVRVSFVECCVKSHWLRPKGEIPLQGVLCQVHHCHVSIPVVPVCSEVSTAFSLPRQILYIYSSARSINLNHSDIVYLQTQLCVYLLMYIQGGYPRASHVKNTEYSILSFSHFHVMLS